MARSLIVSAAPFLLAASFLACSDPPAAPTPPKAIRPVTATTLSGTVGAAVPGGITVRVVDYDDRIMQGIKVSFTITTGDGVLSNHLVLTDGDGLAHTEWTLGEMAGPNLVVASIFGIDSTAEFAATGNPAAPIGVSMTPRILRIPTSATTGTVTGRVVDQFDNAASTATPTYTSRDAAVATVSGDGTVTVTGARGTSTWIIANASGFSDSTHVFALSSTDTPCTGITALATLAVGQVQTTGFVDNGICVPAAVTDREYAIVPFFETPVPSAQTVFTVAASGIKALASSALGALRSRELLTITNDLADANRGAVDQRLRVAERKEMQVRAADARQWYKANVASSGRATRAVIVPTVGTQVEYNVNDKAFCSDAIMRKGHVVAVTSKAVVVADDANPAGGFSDADYQSIGVTFDTLVYQSDATNFGEPTDLDENGGRVVLFFTHAVNELGVGVLGFAYSRDLLPKVGPLGSCPGSNVAELINVYVPDPGNTVAQVRTNVVATMAHELQHVINASRRLYINTNAAPAEERWLNEGLSHVAEELLFYRSTGLSPRQNLGSASLSQNAAAYASFQSQNFARYFLFTRTPALKGPVGVTDDDDTLPTRGAIWSFLRYAADQRFAGNEAAFWQSLENSNSTGLENLTEHIGADLRLVVRDWAMSNYLDDLVPTDPKYTQPSWNIRQMAGFQSPGVCNLMGFCQQVSVTTSANIVLHSFSSEFIRFGVGANQEAYVSLKGYPASANNPLPRHVLLAIVRTK